MSRILRTQTDRLMSKVVEYHGFIYTQGMVTSDSSLDLAGQTRDVLAQIDAALELHGTDSTRLLQAQIWLKSARDRSAFNEVWASWLPDGQAPARAMVEAVLADPAWLVEIMVTACK